MASLTYFFLVTGLGIALGILRDRLADRRMALQKNYELEVQVKESHQRRYQELTSPQAIRETATAAGMVPGAEASKR